MPSPTFDMENMSHPRRVPLLNERLMRLSAPCAPIFLRAHSRVSLTIDRSVESAAKLRANLRGRLELARVAVARIARPWRRLARAPRADVSTADEQRFARLGGVVIQPLRVLPWLRVELAQAQRRILKLRRVLSRGTRLPHAALSFSRSRRSSRHAAQW